MTAGLTLYQVRLPSNAWLPPDTLKCLTAGGQGGAWTEP
jgi:hypothetical protein